MQKLSKQFEIVQKTVNCRIFDEVMFISQAQIGEIRLIQFYKATFLYLYIFIF